MRGFNVYSKWKEVKREGEEMKRGAAMTRIKHTSVSDGKDGDVVVLFLVSSDIARSVRRASTRRPS